MLGRVRKPSSHAHFCGRSFVVSFQDQVWKRRGRMPCFLRNAPSPTAPCFGLWRWSLGVHTGAEGSFSEAKLPGKQLCMVRNVTVLELQIQDQRLMAVWWQVVFIAIVADGHRHILRFMLRTVLNDLIFWTTESYAFNDECCGLMCLKCRTSASGKILSRQDFLLLCEKSLNS